MTDNLNNSEEENNVNPSPEAPPRPPKRNRGLPEWAQIQADISESVAEEPTVVQPETPKAKNPFGSRTPVNTPQPQQPVQPAPPTPVPANPKPQSMPVPTPTPKAEGKPARPSKPQPSVAVPTTPQQTPTPVETPLLKPTVEPEYREKPGFPQAEPAVEEPAFFETEETLEETVDMSRFIEEPPVAEPKPKKQRFKKTVISDIDLEGRSTGQPAGWEPDLTKKQNRKRKNAGGRWKILLVRYSVFGVMAFIVVLGVVRLVTPIPVADIASQVQLSLGYNGFPIAKGQQMAARFTVAYLEYNVENREQREQQLVGFLAPNAVSDFIKVNSEIPDYSQVVIDGPYLVGPADLIDSKRVAFTYVALVANSLTGTEDAEGNIIPPKWVYLEVPMGADENRNVAVVGAPAFVPAPEKAEKIAELPFVIDEKATEQARDTIVDYLNAWAAANPEAPVPSQYLRKDESTYEAQVGLNGRVTVTGKPAFAIEALETEVTEGETPKRNAVAVVTWKTTEGVTYSQKYRLTLMYIDQYWYVLDIKGGIYNAI